MVISWAVCLLIVFWEAPCHCLLGVRQKVSSGKRPAGLALGLVVVFQVIWSVGSLDYYFRILVKPLIMNAMTPGVVVDSFPCERSGGGACSKAF
jgi:hypothetical protein